MTARLSLLDQSGSESPWAEERPEAATPSPAWQNTRTDSQNMSSMPHVVRGNGSTSPFQTSYIGNEPGYSSQYLQQADHGSLAPGSGIETPYVTDSTIRLHRHMNLSKSMSPLTPALSPLHSFYHGIPQLHLRHHCRSARTQMQIRPHHYR